MLVLSLAFALSMMLLMVVGPVVVLAVIYRAYTRWAHEGRFAALRFKGYQNREAEKKASADLRAWLVAKGLEPLSM